MKYVVILGDGMAGYHLSERDNKTCLQLARKPYIDALAKKSTQGLMRTVPTGFAPGSDVANLSVLGYDPALYYTGRSPLEAASIGIPLKDTDVTLRCNLVTLSEEEPFEQKTMLDYSAGEISTEEAKELIAALKKQFDGSRFMLHAGISYRHCLVETDGRTGRTLTPPHDISDRKISPYLPAGEGSEALLAMVKRSWVWGDGTKPALPAFDALHQKKGGDISAVDLVMPIGILAGLQVIDVAGATGNWDTNFQGKANACVDALLEGLDFVYVHMEAPDECGHHGDAEKKIYSIEQIDGVVKTVCERLRAAGEQFSLLICPDHPTPIALKTHTADPVPFLLYRSDEEKEGAARYDEETAAAAGLFLPRACEMMAAFLRI